MSGIRVPDDIAAGIAQADAKAFAPVDVQLGDGVRREAETHLLNIETLLEGKSLNEAQQEMFFNDLARRIEDKCKSVQMPDATSICLDAINFLYRWSKRTKRKPIGFLDMESINTLKRVLTKMTKWSLGKVGGFNTMVTPRFTQEASDTIRQMDIRKVLADNAIKDMAADVSKSLFRMIPRVTL
jgi:hypothetical protein